MRGKVQRQRMHARARRITPAYAGKRVRCSQQALPRTDPRMCGEKHNRSYQQGLERGSPPHVRGKEAQEEWVEQVPRITPACAGKSVSWYVMTSSTWDHPRVCGEKLTIGTGASGVGGITPRMCGEKPSSFFMSMRSAGSPPRMRGKGHRMPINVNQVRITPACAGKRVCFRSQSRSVRDHPRMCGEKTLGWTSL